MSAFRRFVRLLLPVTVVGLWVPLLASPAWGAPGDLDPAFGSGGTLTTPIGSSDDQAEAVEIQSDGKIVVAGSTEIGGTDDFALARYTSTGVLDTTFGGTGKVTTPIGSSVDQAYAVAIQPDGKIVAAGYSFDGVTGPNFALVRYTTSGALDTTFGGTGKVTTPIGSSEDQAYAVAIQPDGKIVAAGFSFIGSTYDFALARYTSTGVLDTTFGGTGKVTTPIGSSDEQAEAVDIQSDGKIVAAGFSFIGSTYDFALARYTSTGALDTTFSGDGKVTTPIGSIEDQAHAVAIQADGKIVAAGFSVGSSPDFALARYTSSGVLDTTFGTGGTVTTPIGSSDDFANAVAIQPDGKIVAAGRSSNGSNADFALARYLTDPPALSIADASVTEGDAGTTNMTFTVSVALAGAKAAGDITVQYATAPDTATSADFVAKSGTLTFAVGQTTKTITMAVKGDLTYEGNETFFVHLSNASGAVIESGTAVGTITDNDGVPDLSIVGRSMPEGNTGTTQMVFTLELTNPSSEYIFVDYATANGTATAGSDYQARSGTKVIKPGRTTAQVTIQVTGDTAPEPDETFFVDLVDADGASLDDPHGIGTILDDDRPTISINDAQVTEGASGTTKTMTFVVALSKASTQTITVAYATANNSAVAPGDYTTKSGTLTFTAGQVSKNIAITIKGDNVTECNESFFVNLSNPTNATIADGQGVGTILTDEPSPCDE